MFNTHVQCTCTCSGIMYIDIIENHAIDTQISKYGYIHVLYRERERVTTLHVHVRV